MSNKQLPKWVTSWPEWFGIEGNTEVVPYSYYEKLQAELAAIKAEAGPEPSFEKWDFGVHSTQWQREQERWLRRRAEHLAARNVELMALLRESRNYVMVFSPSGAPFDFPRDVIARIDAALAANQQEQQT